MGDDEVLVRGRAASVHPDVWYVVTGRPYVLRLMGAGVLRPKHPIPGTDMAGIVESFGSLPRMLGLIAISPFVRELPAVTFSVPSKREVMARLQELLEAGKLTPIIDRIYPLEEVPEATRYLQGGRARGRIIITP